MKEGADPKGKKRKKGMGRVSIMKAIPPADFNADLV